MVLLALAAVVAAAVLAPAAGAGEAATPCRASTQTGVLPAWARAGFSDPRPVMPNAVGHDGRIAAVVFGYPLLSPASANRSNKILWVSRRLPATPAALWIHAQRMVGATPVGPAVTRIVTGGPGPSIVNLPHPGCWRLTLSWSGRRDTLDLAYRS
jgi:hypothetical protein